MRFSKTPFRIAPTNSYSFTAPAVRPDTILCWNTNTISTSGIITTIAAAEISSHGIVYLPWNITIPTDTVLQISSVLMTRANKNSFHADININIAAVKIPGAISGVIIL